MASISSKKIESNFIKKGFTKSHNDHIFLEFFHEGKFVSKTKLSHNGQSIGDNLISVMSKQCKMSKNFFLEFSRCTKSKSDYLEVLKKDNII